MRPTSPTLSSLAAWVLLALACLQATSASGDESVEAAAQQDVAIVEISADPAELRLSGPAARYTLLIAGRTAEGQTVDLTRDATFRSSAPEVAEVTPAGVVRGLADGTAIIEVESHGLALSIPLTVAGSAEPRQFNFDNDIVPLLSRFGCNSSGCHGKAEGQNGFKLSVFGFDTAADYDALAKEGRGRRVVPASAERSLLLRKICGELPHGGGVRMDAGSREYALLREWIDAGLPRGAADDPRVISIRVAPAESLLAMNGGQQLRVVARYSDGREEDVTGLARFQSNNEALISVDAEGLLTAGQAPGQAAVMASYLSNVDVARVIIPRAERIENDPPTPAFNYIDPLVYGQLRKLNVLPADVCSDADFLRRAYLDVVGVLPTTEEARAFLADGATDKRAGLIDALLVRPEYADLWALWWSDLLRVDRQALGHKGAHAYYRWIRQSLAEGKPLDRFAREIVTADGPLTDAPQGEFFTAVTQPGEMASTVSQVFLGVRIACAQCHHHPFDRWSQSDYYGMTAFFAQVGRKNTPLGPALIAAGDPATQHPRTGEVIVAHALAQPMPEKLPAGDRRQLLARWMTAPDNAWFARNIVNRVWAQLLGRGLVEPVDDVRATNPPTNPELLDALAESFIAGGYDPRQLIREIAASRVYQHSSQPNETNLRDEQNYSRAAFKRLPAEVLLDAVCQTTGVPEKFDGLPGGYRAVQVWDSRVSHYFLRLFGRPVRQSACECERNTEASVAQVLHLLNSPEIQAKLSHEAGRVAQLVRDAASDDALAEELYLTFYSRYPTMDERQVAVEYLASRPSGAPNAESRRRAAEDLAWSMLNSLEFVFNH